ncbi:DUF4864 domain-containing protein [Caenimonas terrae]|uniref:DUF4864 domain-containing protein n=1 Tax=Caenimonas terrae TaxID=696074 RepID=A0ABW0NII0_9BURK
MRPALFRLALLLMLAFGAATASMHASATPLAPTDAEAVRQVVMAQLNAFADDDADSAFETATPSVREAIGNPLRFLAMVRGAYPMVYRPASFAFLKPEEDDGTVLQMVQITDGDDKSWIALFALERQPDASWRISGCAVAENPWRPA